MNTLTIGSDDSTALRLWSFLKNELAPFPGRAEAVVRFLLCSAIVIVCSMTLQVPFLALSLIMVFFTAQENTVLTRLSGIVLVIGTTLAIALSLLLLKLTIDNPMLRLLGAGAIAFCGMYFMRISKLGSIGYLVALFVFYSQSFADLYDNPELIVRALLWVWVAVAYPIVVTIAVNFLFLPAHPARLLADEIARQLGEVRKQLAASRQQSGIPALTLDAVERGVQVLHRHLAFATRADEAIAQDKARQLMRIAAIDRLHTAAARLAQLPAAPLSTAQLERVRQLEEACLAVEAAVVGQTRCTLAADFTAGHAATGALDHVLHEMAEALLAFAAADAQPATMPTPPAESPMAADAFSNPVYAQFAAKTVLAAALCYVFYSAVQWPGIHTSMLTCFILALPSLGASSHKGLTRVIGCALGSVVTLCATVFIIPQLESITGLLMLTLPIIAIGAWIAAGSARTNYIGMQFVFAYALALLGQFGPTTDLTEIRDRMIGIVIGVAVFLAVSTWLWPEREGGELRSSLAKLLHAIANLTRAGQGEVDKARGQGWALLSRNRELQGRFALEPGWQYAHDSVTPDMTTWLAAAQQTLFAVNWLQVAAMHESSRLPTHISDALASFKNGTAAALERMAMTMTEPRQTPDDGANTLQEYLVRLEQLCSQDDGGGERQDAAHAIGAMARRVYECIVQLQSGLTTTQQARLL